MNYLNRVQYKIAVSGCRESYIVGGRGLGKSSIIIPQRIHSIADAMPQSSILMLGNTYQNLLMNILPNVLNGLENMGYQEDVHYIVGRRPRANENFKSPLYKPRSSKHVVYFSNGTILILASQDRAGLVRGQNIQNVVVDEGQQIDYEHLVEEVLPAMRGNRDIFDCPEYGGILVTATMPRRRRAMWLMAKEADADEKVNEMIFSLAKYINYKKLQIISNVKNAQRLGLEVSFKKLDNAHDKYLKEYIEEYNALRSKAVLFIKASAFENLPILGLDYFYRLKKSMSHKRFKTEIMNIREKMLDVCFYPYLNKKHFYSSYDNDKLDGIGFKAAAKMAMDCTFDGDCMPGDPLRLSIDWGANINCLCVAQFRNDTIYFIKNIFVKYPLILDDLAHKFCNYYKQHKTKNVYLSYDVTGNQRQANSSYTFAEQFTHILRKNGWTVYTYTNSAAMTHEVKYRLWAKVMKEENPIIKVRYNQDNCRHLIISMENSGIIIKDGAKVRKDKRGERNQDKPQEFETHLSDAMDILLSDQFSGMTREGINSAMFRI